MIDKTKVLTWLTRRLEGLDGGDEWDADDYLAGQWAAFRQIEDLIEENYFDTNGDSK